jgi:hypothetical protein
MSKQIISQRNEIKASIGQITDKQKKRNTFKEMVKHLSQNLVL